MASGDSFSRASIARLWEGGHSQAALHRRAHACPDETKFGCAQLGDSAGEGYDIGPLNLLAREGPQAP
ncbi:hypothetical protein CDL15_Pgr012853 [Punica granatum]|uniref:Uncharacterized protein n=1 Tax=Punica granatum TaxID=22663 RepID=A0A218XGA5_PUNGR|nr:hypothetical protein CDL15_Pgr012853 [Punica granatum]